MKYVEKQYKLIAAKNKLSKIKFCSSCDLRLQFIIPDRLVTADVFFYHINNINLDKLFYNYNKFLSNVINIDYSNLDKGLLYDNILKYNSRSRQINKNHFIETFTLAWVDKDKFVFPDNHYILRPISGFGGSGILYVHNSEDLKQAIKYYKTEKDSRGRPKYEPTDIIVSKIITDLLLFLSS